MATIHPSGSPAPGFPPPDASAFEQHILALLSVISQQPSPSYPFPSSDSPLPTTSEVKLEPFTGKKTEAQQAIETAILSLGDRIKDTERGSSPHSIQTTTSNPANASLLTPEWTPPPGDAVQLSDSPTACPTCARPISNDSTPTPQAQIGDFGSQPLRASFSTPSRSVRDSPGTPAGWSTNPTERTGGMSAEKELELLRAQVQDIARVCKVSLIFTAIRGAG